MGLGCVKYVFKLFTFVLDTLKMDEHFHPIVSTPERSRQHERESQKMGEAGSWLFTGNVMKFGCDVIVM